MKLEGVIAALTTPFREDGSVDRARLRDNVKKYNHTALAGYVAVGSTGEAALLSSDEAEIVWATVLEHSAPGKIVIAGTGAESTAETIARTRRAAKLGYAAALVRTPSYYKPLLNSEVLFEHYRRVADASPIPILIYSIPQFTGVTVEPEVAARLAEHENIIGIKDSSGIVERVAETVRLAPHRFTVLVGSPAVLVESLRAGARGGILALASPLPDWCAQIYSLYSSGDVTGAEIVQEKLKPASKKIGSELGIPAMKYAVDQAGYYGGSPRPPLLPLTAEQRREVDAILATLQASASATLQPGR
ncbi:MAG: dihydrodipicolinate synthase family protein [Candidatus Acidiferrales bacterium]